MIINKRLLLFFVWSIILAGCISRGTSALELQQTAMADTHGVFILMLPNGSFYSVTLQMLQDARMPRPEDPVSEQQIYLMDLLDALNLDALNGCVVMDASQQHYPLEAAQMNEVVIDFSDPDSIRLGTGNQTDQQWIECVMMIELQYEY
jgi:hypothetical protein